MKDMINVENAEYTYPNSGTRAISGFSANFERGEIVAVAGKTGCGKTTLTKLLAGIIRPSSGHVLIDGVNTAGMDLFEIGRRVGYVFQNPNRQLFCDTVYNEVAFGPGNLELDTGSIDQIVLSNLDRFGLTRYRETYPGKLSLGEKQRLALAAVLALGTDYLVLDEPTTGLDPRRRRELGGILLGLARESNCGIVIVSHEADFISNFTDRKLVMTQ